MMHFALGLCALLAPLQPGTTQAASFAVKADKLWMGDGRVLENAVLVVADGKISEVRSDGSAPEGVAFFKHTGSLAPGLIALHGFTGSAFESEESARVSMGEARVSWAFNPSHYDFEDARAAGITTVLLTPTPIGVVPGTSVVVKTAGRRVLRDPAFLSLAFTGVALSPDREPTSFSGSVAALERLFAEKHGVFGEVAEGNLPCLFETNTRQDVARALEFARAHRLTGALHGAVLAGELAAEIKQSNLSVIVPVLDVGQETRGLRAVRELAKAGIPFGFGLDAPWTNAAGLRFSAAMCVREGLEPARALGALTHDAARIAGVETRIGTLERGFDADFVLWSGDPLDLSSRAEAVFIEGERVYDGASGAQR